MPIIKNISQCLKLKSRSKNHYGKKINQNCSKKCSNSLKKGLLFNSYSNIPNLDIRDKPEICGYQIQNKSNKYNKSNKIVYKKLKGEKSIITKIEDCNELKPKIRFKRYKINCANECKTDLKNGFWYKKNFNPNYCGNKMKNRNKSK